MANFYDALSNSAKILCPREPWKRINLQNGAVRAVRIAVAASIEIQIDRDADWPKDWHRELSTEAPVSSIRKSSTIVDVHTFGSSFIHFYVVFIPIYIYIYICLFIDL